MQVLPGAWWGLTASVLTPPRAAVPVLSLVDRREEMDWLASLGYYHWPREGAVSLAPGPRLPPRLLHWDIPSPPDPHVPLGTLPSNPTKSGFGLLSSAHHL